MRKLKLGKILKKAKKLLLFIKTFLTGLIKKKRF